MNTKDTKPTVIEGWISPERLRRMDEDPFGPSSPLYQEPEKGHKPASIVIGDKAVPLSVVVEKDKRIKALENELERILEWHRHETIPLRERELKSIADMLATN